MRLRNVFKKQGGINLLRQYWKGGAFWTAVNQFIVLGKSRTALEILRLSASMKIKQKLSKKYRKELLKFDNNYQAPKDEKPCRKVWFYWAQGIKNAPAIVRTCYEALKEKLDREIILLDDDNIGSFISVPEYIVEKYHNGSITKTHFSDIVRLELLTTYGGTWVDATVLCTSDEKDIPSFYLNSDLFLFQDLKPGRDGHATYISSWFITAKKHNKILEATKRLLYSYWGKNDTIVDYFLFHDFMSIVIDFYPDEWAKVVPVDNSLPHILLLNSDNYSKELVDNAKRLVPFHKLSYKNGAIRQIMKCIEDMES